MERDVDIYDISYEGSGVGRIDGKVVFVPKTLVGETVSAEIVKDTKTYTQAELVKVKKANVNRVQAECPYFDVCGGCAFQHCDRQTELEIKKQILKRELGKVGFCGDVEVVCGEKRFDYRNKVKFDISHGELGYFKAKTHEFFSVKNCLIASQEINDVMPRVEGFLQNNHFQNLTSVYIKQVETKIAVCFLFRMNCENVMKHVDNIEILDGLYVYFAFGNVLESNETKVFSLKDCDDLTKNFAGKEIRVDVSGFNQINDEVAEKLYDYLVDFCTDKRVVNAYSGQGLLTFMIAQKAKFVYGIESQLSAHQSAESLAKMCEDYKISNICGKVEDCLQTVLLRDAIDVIVLDPSRNGCQKSVIEELNNRKIPTILYVSCNFSTLVRDLHDLVEVYDIKSVKLFDMFPCCADMETVVVLEKKA